MSVSTRKQLNHEYGLASNIKSKTVQKDIKIALKSALSRAPDHRCLLCSGVISGTCHIDDDWTYRGAILLEPEIVLQKAQYTPNCNNVVVKKMKKGKSKIGIN